MGQFLAEELFWAATVLTIIGCAISLYFLIFNIHYRKHRLIKMSSPHLNVVTSFGSLLLNICCLLNGLDVFADHPSSTATLTCQIRVWLLVCASTLVFTPILAKSWRVNQIFKKAAFKRVVIKDHRLLTLIGINVMIDITWMILWQTVDPLRHAFIPLIPQSLTSASDANVTDMIILVPACTCNFYPVWISCLFVYKGTIMVYGLYIAWEIRNITLPSMNEARPTIIIIFTVIIVCSSAVPISHLIQEWPVAVKSYNIITIWLCTLIIQCTIFLPKVFLWHKNQDDSLQLAVAQQVAYSSNDSSYEEMSHLVVENSALKKSLQEKEQLIQNLQQHLTRAKDKLMEMSCEDVEQDENVHIEFSSNYSPSDGNNSSHVVVRDGCEGTDSNSIGGTDFYPIFCPPLSSSQPINPNVYKCHNINYFYLDQLRQIKRKNSSKSVHSSLRSVSTEFKLSRLRQSIANELNQAHNLSSTLRDSISKDMNIAHKDNSWVQDAVPMKKTDIAGSIAQSYNLSDDSDTYSYVSSYIPSWTTPYSLNPPAHQNVYASSESLTTLGNDKLYPASRRHDSKHKNRRNNSQKRDVKKKVYIIQDSKVITRDHLEIQESSQVTLSQDTIV